jgi:hypothetical protein
MVVGASTCNASFGERQYEERRMKECLVDVLNARGTVLHVFPIPIENRDGTSKDVDPGQEALKLAVLGQLVTETEAETLQAREHIGRSGPLMPYSDVLETKLQVLHRTEQRVHERAYFLWQEAGCPETRADEHWHRACEIEGNG